MASIYRYSQEDLEFLRQSPLCVKPQNLPPREEYLGPQQLESSKTGPRTGNDRDRTYLGDTTNRRPGSRPGNSDEIVLGPPRTSFPSTSSFRPKLADGDRPSRDTEGARDRFGGFRAKNADGEGDGERYRDNRNNTLRPRRGDVDQDSDGWTPVTKSRKSFGHDGAERFHGRMGGERNHDRGDRRRDRDDREREGTREGNRERRNFDTYPRDRERDVGDGDTPRRNGLNRARSDNPWHKETNDGISQRDKIEKLKNWRDRGNSDADTFRERDRERGDRERGNDRYGDRRYNRDRDQRQEAEPEWIDAPVTGPTQQSSNQQSMNQADFVEFMKRLKSGGGPRPAKEPKPEKETATLDVELEAEVDEQPLQVLQNEVLEESLPSKTDKFFEKFAVTDKPEFDKEASVSRPKLGGAKPSRFTSFFTTQQQDGPRRQAEPHIPAASAAPPLPPPDAVPASGPLPASSEKDKQDFQVLLQKLQSSSHGTYSPPVTTTLHQPPPVSTPQDLPSLLPQHVSPEPIQHQFGMGRRDEGRPRLQSQPSLMQQEVISPRPIMGMANPAAMRSEQMLQELGNQRHSAQSQGSSRHEPLRNSNAEFLMGLMQSARHAPEPPAREELLARLQQEQHQQHQHQQQQQQQQRQQQLQQRQNRQQQAPQQIPQQIPQQQPQQQQPMMSMLGREPDFLGAGPQRPMGRIHPGFMDEQFHQMDQDRQQPTHILQRPPPPGLEHPTPSWMGPGGPNGPTAGPGGPNGPVGGQISSHQRPMIPPPGLGGQGGNPPRSAPPPGMGPNMFPPSFGGGPGFPDNMVGPPPPRGMQPPPGLYGGPPFGGMPHPGMGGFQGSEGIPFGGPGGPADGRGMLPPFMRR
ncbi:hypothetical protein MKZ38_009649 [Zalerion maritima]|uniref:Uncharacterized protein n=1 Tax=Zalerion maritima TaxID=339359 RepID=A0AAD5RV18_9PEZI|nr:hypothetical protein MKZ38_009649 [Zalerion maritima]